MKEVDIDGGIDIALRSLVFDRLAILAGAGLSMAPPSNLPSALQIGRAARERYAALFGPPPFSDDIAEQADYFFENNELGTVFLRKLIPRDEFAGHYNSGHTAVADLILIGALRAAVTTNIDTMIEAAGQALWGQIETGVDEVAMQRVAHDCTPLLKIHGCRQIGLEETIWSARQLEDTDTREKLQRSAAWLSQRISNHDILVVGYCTDWDYLNSVLDFVFQSQTPVRLIVVNPADDATMARVAPQFFTIGERATGGCFHVRCSGADFLDRLRLKFSESYLRQILASGGDAYTEMHGTPPDQTLLEPPPSTNETYLQLRRDMEGCFPRKPATHRRPIAGPLLGLTLLQLRAAGATVDGLWWTLGSQTVRVLRGEGQLLHAIKAAFDGEVAPIVAPDIVIAVGAEAASLPSHIVRDGTPASITRGASVRWMTREQATMELLQ
jgi:hypothetical protein